VKRAEGVERFQDNQVEGALQHFAAWWSHFAFRRGSRYAAAHFDRLQEHAWTPVDSQQVLCA
jgi:hypothetical protein